MVITSATCFRQLYGCNIRQMFQTILWNVTCLMTSLGSFTTADFDRLEPLIRMARWKRFLDPWLTGERSRSPVSDAPVPCPIMVTLSGSPPNWEMFSWKQNYLLYFQLILRTHEWKDKQTRLSIWSSNNSKNFTLFEILNLIWASMPCNIRCKNCCCPTNPSSH